MKPKVIIVLTILFILQMAFASHLTLLALTGKGLHQLNSFVAVQTPEVSDDSCTGKEKITGLENSENEHLKKLYDFQEVCASFVSDRMMLFSFMPNSTEEADRIAEVIGKELIEFHKFGVTPVVIIEPETSWGLIDFLEFREGLYDSWIKEMFVKLKQLGVTDEIMGIWVPFPEANLPYWNRRNSTPEDFAAIVNRYLGIGVSVFPNMKGSVLLNSSTYESDDFNWENGEFASLVPYVKDLDQELVQSFGLQGFPWIPAASTAANADQNTISPYYYLSPGLAAEAAEALGTNEIWFNTGTFDEKFANDPDSISYLQPGERKSILLDTINIIDGLREDGYDVWLNIFAEDKSTTAEGTDWSYWFDPATPTPSMSVFQDFIETANSKGILLSLFDR